MFLCAYPNGKLKPWQYALVSIVLTTFIREGNGIRITQCVSNMVELDMESSNNEITCVWDIGADTMTWSYQAPGSDGIIDCSSSGSCTSNSLFTATRGSLSTSSTLTPEADIKINKALYGNTKLTCFTRHNITGDETGRTSCELDVVHQAEVTSCSAQFNTVVGTAWTANGSCVISKVLSQRGRYTCSWTETTSGTSKEIQSTLAFTEFDEGGVTYRSMTCDFLKSLPRVTGNYSYTAVISPGAVQPGVNFKGSPSIVLPTAHTDCPTDYVMEGDNVDCTCSSTNGNPAGSAVWRDSSDSSRLLLNDVRRNHHDDSYVCEVKWGSDVVSNATFRLQVAYGPDNVTITGPPQPFDTNGTNDMTLSCTAGPSRPGVTYQWRRHSGGGDVNGNQLPLTNVGKSDDGDEITCTAVNTYFSALSASRTLTLDLNYPPTKAPVIRSSSIQGFVNQGDLLTLTCSVRGGKPVNATTLTFDCPDKQDSNDVHNTAEVNSSVTFDSVVASDNGRVCTCRGRWKTHTDWYTPQARETVVVHYAPPSPSINAGSQPYPFRAGESPTLYCNYPAGADLGNPSATLTLNNQAGGTGQGQVSVTLDELSSTDNGRRMVCEASNQFTTDTNTRVTQELLLDVYYLPVISVTSLPSDECSLSTSSSSVTCVIAEGQRVNVNCTAHSNPSIATIAWQTGGGSVLDMQVDRGKDIDYRCNVTTVNKDGSDQRLPLQTSTELAVLVQYGANVAQFTVDGYAINQTVVNETNTISLNCTAKGRPTAGILLKKNGNVIGHRNVGDVSRDDVAVLVNTRQRAQCEDAGLYTCSANNTIGDPDEHDVKVFVNCKPRSTSTEPAVPLEVNYENKPVFVPFGLVAFPVPDVLSFTVLINGSVTNITGNIKLSASCSTTDTDYEVACNVTVNDATNKEAEGLYTFSAANAFGKEDFEFRVAVNGTITSAEEQTTSLDIAAVAGGIGAALVVIALVAVVVLIVRHRRKGAEKSTSTPNRMNGVHEREETVDDEVMIENTAYVSSVDDEVMIENTAYVSSAELTSRVQGNGYEVVELKYSTPASGACVSVPGSSGENASASAQKDLTTVNPPTGNDGCNLYSTVNKGTKQSLSAPERPGTASVQKQRPDVKPKPAKKLKPGKAKDKPPGKKIAKHDEKQLLRAGEYSNVAMASLTMSPHDQEGSVYENYAFEKEEGRQERQSDEGGSRTMNEDSLVYTTVAFSDKQLKKAEETPPEREQTEYADIDFTRKAPYAEATN